VKRGASASAERAADSKSLAEVLKAPSTCHVRQNKNILAGECTDALSGRRLGMTISLRTSLFLSSFPPRRHARATTLPRAAPNSVPFFFCPCAPTRTRPIDKSRRRTRYIVICLSALNLIEPYSLKAFAVVCTVPGPCSSTIRWTLRLIASIIARACHRHLSGCASVDREARLTTALITL